MLRLKLLLFMIIGSCCNAAEKSWMPDVDIFNPNNWVQNKDSGSCKGIIFTEDIPYTYIDEIFTETVVLPINGKVFVNSLKFVDSSKCIQIGEMHYNIWFDPNSWYVGDNAAVPPTQRIPCVHDHVSFVKDFNSAVFIPYMGYDITVKSLTFGDRNLTNEELQYLIQENRDWLIIEDDAFKIAITNEDCEEEEGCLCRTYQKELAVCAFLSRSIDIADRCEQPILPVIYQCDSNKVCGGQILFTPLPGFNLNQFRKLLPTIESVDTYASKVTPDGQTNYIQVVFTSKSGTDSYEKSIDAATEFFQELGKDEIMAKYKIRLPKLKISGPPKDFQAKVSASVSLVFGTLVGVLAFFLIVYVFYVGPLRNSSIASRFTFQRGQLRSFHPFSAVRYDNKEEERLMFERQSIAGSVLSLERAFDNPMYGKPSTSSSSTLESTLNDQKWDEAQSIEENPMLEIEMKAAQDKEEIENIK